MKAIKLTLVIVIIGLINTQLFAQNENKRDSTKNPFYDFFLADLLDIELEEERSPLVIYGFASINAEKVFKEPDIADDGSIVTSDVPFEIAAPSTFHLYGRASFKMLDILFNLGSNDGAIEIRNVWGNVKVHDLLQFKIGKIYRSFGLFNPKLDQVPTFLGIEPPELFDKDHLMLPRTTSIMMHGTKKLNDKASLLYAISTDNGEGGPGESCRPFGWDLRIKNPNYIIGASGYISSIGLAKSTSTVELGAGSPRGGILPWMVADHYTVVGGFLEARLKKLLIQSAFWTSNHDAERNPTDVLTVINSTKLNHNQRLRFLGEKSDKPDSMLTESDVVTAANYIVQTFYLRLGYTIQTKNVGTITPYAFFDYYSNPETIRSKTYGGDNEAGFADDGEFVKPSIGIVYKPINQLAVKIDGSFHKQTISGESISYPEIRFDISYAFK